MPRQTVAPVVTHVERFGGAQTEEEHPAFAVAKVARAQGTPRNLFQSDLQHNHTIVLSISQATRNRDLKHDWVHPRNELIEIEMSEAQWGALVSSMGLGSGVPVTLRRTESEVFVPGLPYQPRIGTSIYETKQAVTELLEEARASLADLENAIESKAGVKATREALGKHVAVLRNAESTAGFAVKALADAAEKVVSQAKADIEIQILNAARLVSDDRSIEAPLLPAQLQIGETDA